MVNHKTGMKHTTIRNMNMSIKGLYYIKIVFFRYFLVFLLMLFGATHIFGQQFPVDISVNLLPPYSLNLSDYGNGSRDLVSVGILLRDINEPSVQVRLDLRIEDNSGIIARGAPVVSGITPIFVEGGSLLRLDGFDLSAYFRLENLVGITPDRYHQSLQEGLYRFCFTVYDVLTGKALSRDGCGTVYLSQNDPPILNIPGNGEQVLVSDPQNIRFNWTPRHVNATNVTYDFRMVELWDKNLDPQFGFISGRRIYETSTAATTLLYGPAETQLLPNTSYAWQVQARVADQGSLGGSSSFKNDGKSEIFHFVYSAACLPPTFVIGESRSSSSEKILWQGGDHITYRLEYRNASGSSSEWFTKETVNDYVLLHHLEPGTRYEFRVGGQCQEEGSYSYSQIQEFTTPTGDNAIGYNCGLTPSLDITNQEALSTLLINDVFTVGDFPVTVKAVTTGNTTVQEDKDESGNIIPTVEVGRGRFSGWGYIVVPYLGDTRLKVNFTNVAINTDYELTQGFVMTDFDPNGGGMVDIGDVVDNFTADDQEVSVIAITDDLDIEDITVNEDGSITITHPDGSTSQHEREDNVMIVDGNGDVYYVDENGQVIQGGTQGDAITSDSVDGIAPDGTVTGLTAKGIQVFFDDDPAYQFGFDTLPAGSEAALSDYYETIPDGSGGDYHIAHKFLARNLEESLQASVSITDNDLSMDDLVFKTKEGEVFTHQVVDATTIRIPLKGRFANAVQTLYAVLPKEGTERTKEQIAGVITLHHYEFKPVSVTLVPVGDVNLPALEEVTTHINGIYNRAGVTMDISTSLPYDPGADLYGSDGTIDVEDSAMLSHYTKDQKALIKDYKAQGIDKNRYYVFVLGEDIRPSLAQVAGFMPLKGQFGFVFQGAGQTEKGKTGLVGTLAHELGHGIFGLEHPFDRYGTVAGATDELMDYGRGVGFSHMDWQQIHDPNFRLYLFQNEEDAAYLSYQFFLTPEWEPFSIDNDVFAGYFRERNIENMVQGAVYGIVIRDKELEATKYYTWNEGHKEYLLTHIKFDQQDEITQYLPTINALGSENQSPEYEILPIQKADNDTFDIKDEDDIVYIEHSDLGCVGNVDYRTTWGFIKDKKGVDIHTITEPSTIIRVGGIFCNDDMYKYEFENTYYYLHKCNESEIPFTQLNQEIENLRTLVVNDADADEVIKTLSNTHYCALQEKIEEEVWEFLWGRIEAHTKSLGETSDYEENFEKAVLNLMIGSSPATKYKALTKNDNELLSKLLYGLHGVRTSQWFEDDNIDRDFIDHVKSMISYLDDFDKQWDIINGVIKTKYDVFFEGDYDEAITEMLTEIYKESLSKEISGISPLFIEMLVDDLAHLIDYQQIFEIAKLRHENREAFANFTMIEETFASGTISTDFVGGLEEYWVTSGKDYFGPIADYSVKDQNDYKWGKTLKNAPSLLEALENNPDSYFARFQEVYSEHLQEFNIQNEEFWESYTEIKCSNLEEILTHIALSENSKSLANVALELRIEILKTTLSCGEYGSIPFFYLDHYSGLKNPFMKVCLSIPDNSTEVLDMLEELGVKKVLEYYGHVSSQKEVYSFMVWWANHISKNGRIKPLSNIGISLVNKNGEFIDSHSNKLLRLESNLLEFKNFSTKIQENNTIYVEDLGQTLDYNQMVLVYVHDDFTFLGKRYRKGTPMSMPLIQALAMSESNRDIVTEKGIWIALDVVFIAVGGGVVLKMAREGVRLYRVIAGVSDIIGGAVGIFANVVDESTLSPETRFYLNMVTIGMSAPDILISVRDILKAKRLIKESSIPDAKRSKYIQALDDYHRVVYPATFNYDLIPTNLKNTLEMLLSNVVKTPTIDGQLQLMKQGDDIIFTTINQDGIMSNIRFIDNGTPIKRSSNQNIIFENVQYRDADGNLQRGDLLLVEDARGNMGMRRVLQTHVNDFDTRVEQLLRRIDENQWLPRCTG